MSHTLPPQYYAQLYDLQAVDFVLLELTLYLDTHPQDVIAIQQFNQFAEQRKPMLQAFEAEFGPMYTNGLSFSKQPWQWVESPWPWQI